MQTNQTTNSPNRMFPHRPIHLLLGLLAVAFLAGCSFLRPQDDPTRFYVLTVLPAATEHLATGESSQLKIGLKAVEMPAYLRSRSMVVRTGTNEIHFAEFDRWAEPLDQGISRVMKENLIASDKVASVTLNSHGDTMLNCEVVIRILACEGVREENGTGSIRFATMWEVQTVGTNSMATARGGFTADAVAWDGKTYAQLAERLSKAIAGASTALAADLPMEAKMSPQAALEILKPSESQLETDR